MISCCLIKTKAKDKVLILDLKSNKSMTFNCTVRDFDHGMSDYQNGMLMQDAFHFLNADEREFLISGTTPEEWKAMFGDG